MLKKAVLFIFIIFFAFGGIFSYQFAKFNDNKLHLVFCDVGQGDAIFIRTSTGANILIDGGPDDSVLNCLSKHMPFWDKKIQAIILTHPHADHFTGLISVVKRYNVMSYDTENVKNPGFGTKILQDNLAVKNLSAKYLQKGDRLTNQSNFSLLTLWPSADFIENSTGNSLPEAKNLDLNGFSVIELLSYGNFKALLTGDAGVMIEERIAKEAGRVNVLKVPHHGSKTGMSDYFLKEIAPSLAIISVGAKNLYGHPSRDALTLLKNNNIKFLRTDKDGEVEIVSDGKTWQLIN